MLKSLSISTRIILLALLPTLVVAAYSVQSLMDSVAEQAKLQDLAKAMVLAKETGGLLREIQTERDLSMGFFSGHPIGSAGKAYRSQLSSQRRKVDNVLAEFRHYLNVNHDDMVKMGIEERMEDINSHFKHLSNTRNHVDRLEEFDQDKMHVKWRYAGMNTSLLKTIDSVIVLSADNRNLSLLTGAYGGLILLDNRFSGERSFGLEAFSREKIDYSAIGNNMAIFRQIEDMNLRIFAYAPEKVAKAYWNGFMTSDIHQKMDKTRREIMGKGGDAYAMTPQRWFDLASQNMAELRKVISLVEAEIQVEMEQALSDASDKVWLNAIVLLLTIIIIIVISLVIIRSIITPLKALIGTLESLAESKDLSQQLNAHGKDELANVAVAFNSLMQSFSQAINNVQNEVKEITKQSDDVSHSMQQNQNLAENQNEATDNVSVAINEMTATIQEVASLSQNTAEVVGRAHGSSIDSATKASSTKAIMEELLEELSTTEQQVSRLNDETAEIGNVLSVIQSIAEQTNLLALNAAIEAARAGEQGRGFAVVADEVRTLASKTQDSTQQIREQIETLQSESRGASSSMEALRAKGDQAVEEVVSSATGVEGLREELDTIASMSEQIATAAEEQTVVAGEINQRIHSIKSDTEELYQHTEASSKACVELKSSGQKLNEYAQEFKID